MVSVRVLNPDEARDCKTLLRLTGAVGAIDTPQDLDPSVDIAVAYIGQRPVGSVAIRPQRRESHVVADLRGGVLVGDRGRGAGTALIDWFCDEGLVGLGSQVIEAVVDDSTGDEALRCILQERGFVAEDFVEMTAPTLALEEWRLPVDMAVSVLEESDIPLAAEIYGSANGARVGIDHAERDLLAVWRSQFASRKECLVVRRKGVPEGFVIAFRWPDDPEDLWIECLSVEAGGSDGGAESAHVLLTTLRSTGSGTRSVSTGVGAGLSEQYGKSGFQVRRRWSRFRQVFVAG